MAEALRFKYVDPNDLKNHPLNIELYGTIADPAFVEDVKRRGIRVPIHATPDLLIIGGHRRRQAAKIARLKRVPVLIDSSLSDDLDIREALIRDNRTTRDRTVEERAREFAELKRIEEARAAAGPTLDAKSPPKDPPAAKSPRKSGRSDTKAAAAVGLKRTTARKAAAVVEEIDKRTANGDKAGAAALRESLNNGSVHVAAKAAGVVKRKVKSPARKRLDVDRYGQDVPASVRPSLAFGESDKVKAVRTLLRDARKAIGALGEGPGRESIPISRMLNDVENAITGFQFGVPHCVCPICKGAADVPAMGTTFRKCIPCKGRGWIPVPVLDAIPPESLPEGARQKSKKSKGKRKVSEK